MQNFLEAIYEQEFDPYVLICPNSSKGGKQKLLLNWLRSVCCPQFPHSTYTYQRNLSQETFARSIFYFREVECHSIYLKINYTIFCNHAYVCYFFCLFFLFEFKRLLMGFYTQTLIRCLRFLNIYSHDIGGGSGRAQATELYLAIGQQMLNTS